MNEPDNNEEPKTDGETEPIVTAEPSEELEGTEIKVVDLTDSQADENVTPADFGKDEAMKTEGENVVTEDMKDDQGFVGPDKGTQDDGVNDHRLSTVKPEKDIPIEAPIEYLFNPSNKRIFPVNDAIVKQRHLVPCTKEGKVLSDHRRPSDFR